MSRTIRVRFAISAILWLGVLGLALRPPADRVIAQEPPTKVPIEVSTKPPIEVPTKPPVEPSSEPATKAPIEPTAVPPLKPTATSLPTKAPWTSTPVPTDLPTKTPIGLLPTKLPIQTNSPTPQPGSSDGAPTPDHEDAGSHPTVPAGAVEVVATPAVNVNGVPPTTPMLIGVVFEDLNANGVQDGDERGLAGVAVVVEATDHAQTLITDASGAYAARNDPQARVRVIPPAGWLTSQPDPLPLDRARSFPLHSVAVDHPSATLTAQPAALDLTPLIALGIGLGVVLSLSLLRLARVIAVGQHQLALLLVRLQRTSERPQVIEAAQTDRAVNESVLALLNQAGLDGAGQPLQIERVVRVSVQPRPAIITLGRAGSQPTLIVFTPLDRKVFRARLAADTLYPDQTFADATDYPLARLRAALDDGRSYPLDALNSGLFIADDLAAAYAWLAADIPVALRTLPRVARWQMWVAPLPRPTLTVQAGWRRRLRRLWQARLKHVA